MAKRGSLEHPKTLALADALDIDDPFALGLLEAFWHHVAKYHDDGDLTGLSPSVLCRSIRYRGDAKQFFDALIACHFIDVVDGRMFVHDWPEHADDAVHMRLARTRKRFADGTVPSLKRFSAEKQREIEEAYAHDVQPVSAQIEPKSNQENTSVRTVCAHDAHTMRTVSALPEPEPEPEPLSPLQGPPTGDPGKVSDIEAAWDEFLRVYPPRSGDRKVSQGREKFRRRIRLGTSAEKILEGARRYRAWCDATGVTMTERVQQITTWINGEAWNESFDLPEQVPRASPAAKRLEPVLDRDYYFGDSEPVEDDDGAVRYRMKAFWIRDGKRTDEPFERSDWFQEHGLADFEAVAV